VGKEQLAACGAVQRHARTGLQVQPQRPGRFDAVDVEDFRAGQHGQVAGFADAVDQRAQDRPALGVRRIVAKCRHREAQRSGAERQVALAAAPAQDPAGLFELRAQPVHGRLRPAELHRQPVQRQALGIARQLGQQHERSRRDRSGLPDRPGARRRRGGRRPGTPRRSRY